MHLTEMLRRRILYNDEFALGYTVIHLLDVLSVRRKTMPYEALLASLDRLTTEGYVITRCSDFAIRRLLRLIATYKCYHNIQHGNKTMYFYMKCLGKNIYGNEIASSKLWLATFLLQQGDYCRSLQTVNDVLYHHMHNIIVNLSKEVMIV